MKRLALLLAAAGVVGSSAFAIPTVQAYQPVDAEVLFADPDVMAPSDSFEAVLQGCFPGEPGESGEQVLFFNLGVTPNQSAVANCDQSTYEARVTFQAPATPGEYRIVAVLMAGTSANPDIPDRPYRFLEAFYEVNEGTIELVPGPGETEVDGGVAAVSTSGSGDIWPDFLTSVGFYRTFLALLALMAGIFFVVLWRRRREDERVNGTYGPGVMPPPDPSTPSIA